MKRNQFLSVSRVRGLNVKKQFELRDEIYIVGLWGPLRGSTEAYSETIFRILAVRIQGYLQ